MTKNKKSDDCVCAEEVKSGGAHVCTSPLPPRAAILPLVATAFIYVAHVPHDYWLKSLSMLHFQVFQL